MGLEINTVQSTDLQIGNTGLSANKSSAAPSTLFESNVASKADQAATADLANALSSKTSGIVWGKAKHAHTEGKDEKNSYVGKAKIKSEVSYELSDDVNIKGTATNRAKFKGSITPESTKNDVNTYSSDVKVVGEYKNDGVTYSAGAGYDTVTGVAYPVASAKGSLGEVGLNSKGPHTPDSSAALFKTGKAGDAMQGVKNNETKKSFSEFTEVNPNGVMHAKLNPLPIGDSDATVQAAATYNLDTDKPDAAITVKQPLDTGELIVDIGYNGTSDTWFGAASQKEGNGMTTAYAEQGNGSDSQSIYGVAHKEKHSKDITTETGAFYSDGANGKSNSYGVKETVSLGNMKDGQLQVGMAATKTIDGDVSGQVTAAYYKKF